MQTFLPYEDFTESARVLDYKRLGKQRVEGLQLIQIILRKKEIIPTPTDKLGRKKKGFWNHPVVKMWENHPFALIKYTIEVCREWRARGYQDTIYGKVRDLLDKLEQSKGLRVLDTYTIDYPKWLGNEALHLSHRSNLLRKFPEHYSKYFPDVPSNLPYIYPE